ncbi:peptide-methionine (S)-S-oxide reductase MsrA [Gordonia sp. PP30]|uniref:peptide-methionine (S)-S-oxide reductase MsrA n=1 Tax=Gordonia sp. PP30 TaxID=2935861 RepID=UPI001FFEE7C7|nr:peptide-methionine (S)-S-oxide reductase MsrA [Gordonia sp. PP30]UQE75169.1 peptide-methionine (S)-S-oxide reductase MsrA [Gordonia sp. PP30]
MSIFDRLQAAADVKRVMVDPAHALPGRDEEMPVPAVHAVLGHPLRGEPEADGSYANGGVGTFDGGLRAVVLAGGCFWGVEEILWGVPGVYTTAAGYAGGYTPNPTYEEVCTAKTGHTESVLVVFDPAQVSLDELLAVFFTAHDPTQEMRQGNDIGTQYRSAVFTFAEDDNEAAVAAARRFEPVLAEAGYGPVTTEISLLDDAGAGRFFYAEPYHQQYLHKNPNGYRCHAATGLTFPTAG